MKYKPYSLVNHRRLPIALSERGFFLSIAFGLTGAIALKFLFNCKTNTNLASIEKGLTSFTVLGVVDWLVDKYRVQLISHYGKLFQLLVTAIKLLWNTSYLLRSKGGGPAFGSVDNGRFSRSSEARDGDWEAKATC